jgi:hypothetical protein
MHQTTTDSTPGPHSLPRTHPADRSSVPTPEPEGTAASTNTGPTHPIEVDRKLIEQLRPADPDPDDPVSD